MTTPTLREAASRFVWLMDDTDASVFDESSSHALDAAVVDIRAALDSEPAREAAVEARIREANVLAEGYAADLGEARAAVKALVEALEVLMRAQRGPASGNEIAEWNNAMRGAITAVNAARDAGLTGDKP